MMRRWLWGVGVLAVVAAGSISAQGPSKGESIADMETELLALLQEAREQAGVGRLDVREVLNEVARRRAESVASLPHARRLSVPRSIGEDAVEAGESRFLRIKLHQDLSRGAQYPASAFFRNWQRYANWQTAMDPEFDAVGLGIARADDGWMVLAAVFFQDLPVPKDLPALERATADGVNAVRRDLGLGELAWNDWLAAVARAHSEDMARRDYVDHRSPDGVSTVDRVRAAGGHYKKLAENIFMGSGLPDPAAHAVTSWMDSRGHRKNILNPDFTETGLGIAVDDRGRVYFTQLFYTPAE